MCAHTAVCLCFQRGARRLAGGRRGRSEACRTGACGHLTFSDGWRSCEPRRPIMGCWTWLAPSGLTSPSAASWAMTAPSPSLRLRSEMKGTDGKLKDLSTGRSYLFRCLQEKVITCDDKSLLLKCMKKECFLHALNLQKKPQKQCHYAFYLNMFTAGRYNVGLYN